MVLIGEQQGSINQIAVGGEGLESNHARTVRTSLSVICYSAAVKQQHLQQHLLSVASVLMTSTDVEVQSASIKR